MTKDIYYKQGSGFRKYWWVLILIGMIFYFWPQDHFNNCLNDYPIKFRYAKKDRALEACSRVKKNHPDIFKEFKGKVFTNSDLFYPDGSGG